MENSKEIVLNTLTQQSHWVINKKLTHYMGSINSSLYLSNLISWYSYFQSKDMLENDGSFYTTTKQIQKDTFLSKFQQTKILKFLAEKKLVNTKIKGIPAKQYKTINFDTIAEILCYKERKNCADGSVKILPLYKNNNKYNKNKEKEEPKGSYKTSSEVCKTFMNGFAEECIKTWNSFPHTQNVRITSRTNTIENIEKYIKELRRGVFLKGKFIDVEWFRRNKISATDKKHSKEDILLALNALSLFLKEGYPPENKNFIPKSLVECIYNPRTQKSWFLKSLNNPPKPLSAQIKDTHPKITKFFSKRLNLNGRDKKGLVYGIDSIVKFHKQIPEETLDIPALERVFGTPKRLCEQYWNFLEDQDWLEIKPNLINTNNKLWDRFIKECEEDVCDGYKLNYKGGNGK